MIATKTAVELVHFEPENPRATSWFRALIAASAQAGLDVIESTRYTGAAPWLLLWGPGAPARRDAIRDHVAKGGRAIALDLAYWHRERKIRVSFDAPHPQAYVMRRPLPVDRLVADGIVLTNEWNPDGPIVIAGLGEKARVQYGQGNVDAWEAEMARDCLDRWSKAVGYRPKRADGAAPSWATKTVAGGAIEDAIRGVSLVITWHSNVAVDAIRMGIPVVCRDGAAAAVCPSTIPDRPEPLAPAVRDRFLANLAHFQYSKHEAAQFWRFAQEMLS